jgi:hypothetical protein
MKKIGLLALLFVAVINCYSQDDFNVDSIKINSETNDSIEIIVYTAPPGCYVVDSIKFVNQIDSMTVSYYYSEEFPQCDCDPYRQRYDLFKIKKDSFKKVIFYSIIRNVRDYGTSYSEYFLFAKGTLSLTSVNEISIEKSGDVTIFPNPVSDRFYVTKKDGSACFVQLYNLFGNTLIEKKIHNSEYFDISYLPNGLYFLVINHNTVYKLLKY